MDSEETGLKALKGFKGFRMGIQLQDFVNTILNIKTP
jgi:hypothetical protein